MASSLVQIRVDDKLKEDVTAVYEQLGLDLSTAVRMFFKRSVAEQGIPFSVRLNDESKINSPKNKISSNIMTAMQSMANSAAENGISDMNLDEINAEISSARKEL